VPHHHSVNYASTKSMVKTSGVTTEVDSGLGIFRLGLVFGLAVGFFDSVFLCICHLVR
jgi:hypothetical protein